MDGSAIEHSDSDSGDSWTLLDNSNYAEDAPDVPDHPTASTTPENHDKDDDTDGISIISDSEPDSPSPCQINYEHYLSEENSSTEHPIPQFIPVNPHLSDISHDSDKDEDDFLGDSNGKHKTYVHRRNKRLSTFLNIVMLGSVITAAGIAIGHMWGAKTDCSMHTTTNINKILSNLYKLQEENAYLRGKLKELTVFNIQTNQKTASKYNKCKKTFEEPLINDNSNINNKFTKCVDDKKLLKSHMAEAVPEQQILFEGAKNSYQDGKKCVLEQKEKYFKNPNPNHDIDKDSNKLDDGMRKKKLSDEYLNETKNLRYDRKCCADSLKHIDENKEIHIDSDATKDISFGETGQPYTNERKRNNKMNIRDIQYRKDHLMGDIGSLNEGDNSKMDFHKRKAEFGTDDFIIYDKSQNIKKKDNNKTIKLKYDFDIDKKNILPFMEEINIKNIKKQYRDFVKNVNKTLKDHYDIRDEISHKKYKKIKEKNRIKTENNKEENYAPIGDNEEYFGHSKEKKMKRKRKVDSDEVLKKDDRYTGQRKKKDRKTHDRRQSHKKIKRKNKYEQWEMKGGILKDFEELSESSFQENENYFNVPNLMDHKKYINNFDDNKADKKIGTDDNKNDKRAGNFIDMQNRKGDINVNSDEKDWLDKRASFRKEARQRLQHELFGKNIPNAADWYFRRMRKREQNREKTDNSTYKKLLKRNMNYKLKR